MMVGPGMPSHDGDSREELAAIAALEGLGVLSDSERALVDEDRVRELEHAAGAIFTALGQGKVRRAPAQIVDRLQDLLSAQTVAEAEEDRHGGVSHLSDTLSDMPQRRSASRSSLESEQDETSEGMSATRTSNGPSARSSRGVAEAGRGRSSSRLALVGGWMAAAILLIATITAYGRLASLESSFGVGSADARRSEMIATAADVEVLPWSSEGVSGDVTWSDASNSGFMRIEGLALNDPSVSQYQLWIFRGLDPAAEAHPVSGGVFDVSLEGEVVIPIDAQLKLGRAGLFAVTVEQPGGVVVSEREQIVLVASRA